MFSRLCISTLLVTIALLAVLLKSCGSILSIFDGDDGEILYITNDYGGSNLCIYRIHDKQIRILNFDITPEQYIHRARLSPDKKLIAAQMEPSNVADAVAATYIFDRSGILLSSWGSKVSDMCWSPDGTKLAYNRSNATGWGTRDYAYIYVSNIDGSDTVQIFHSTDNSIINRDWFNDGRSLLTSNMVRETHPVDQKTHAFEYIYKLDINTGELIYIYNKLSGASEYRVSPDGSRISFIELDIAQGTNGDRCVSICVMEVDSGNKYDLASFPVQLTALYGPIWSPEGDKLLIAKKYSSGGEHNAEMAYFDLDKKEFVNI
ncbi:hypothetical protein ACFLT7_02215 [candidate division KSB1 bacterium]